ncbi:MAG: DUF924 domain-containing protein [Comamonadaceae bacterium]|nr:MAG: DUF924 domain-containing protein [Comamonadaceae bacterium]
MTGLPTQAADVLAFWRDAGPERWFRKDDAFDAAFRERFLGLHEQAAAGALDDWADTADGALALLILLDQFPRNAFRGTARVYATDPQARRIAQQALARGDDTRVQAELRPFLVLPMMHSEDPADQALSVEKTAPIGGENHRFALHHQDIVRRFGRFPHRNAVLGRASTPEEERFLAEGGFTG